MRYHERMIMLSVLDAQWKDHLLGMDHLKEGIGLRGYGQHDPLVEYKRESFDMFEAMMQRFQEETVRYLYLMQILERPAEPGSRERSARGATVSRAPNADVPSLVSGGRTAIDRPPRPSRLPWTIWKKRSSARRAGNSSRPAWPVPATGSRCSKWCAAEKKSAATILAPAAPARNTRSAAAPPERRRNRLQLAVQPYLRLPAAKRRKNAAHDATGCGKTHRCLHYRGRAALQGRVSRLE